MAMAVGIWAGELSWGAGWWSCNQGTIEPQPVWLLLPLPLLVWTMWRWPRSLLFYGSLSLAFMLLGIWRYAVHPFEPCPVEDALTQFHADNAFARPLVMEGVVNGYPQQRDETMRYRLAIDTVWQGEKPLPVHGQALVSAQADAGPFHYGDRLRIRGTPVTPPSYPDFNYRRFLARKGIHTLVQHADLTLLATGQGQPWLQGLYAARAAASAMIERLLPQPYAALANGMILGIESGIPRRLYDQFNLTGASHVIVISGSNIAIVSGILLGLFSRLLGRRKRLATTLTLSGIALYTVLAGADAAVVRAAIMGAMYVVAVHLQRQSSAMISLFFAALLMLLANPLTLWDVGFQLSFMATLGLVLFNAPLKRRWDTSVGKHLPPLINGILAEGLLVTAAAQFATMPLVVAYFGRLSLISFIVNLLIIPVQPPIMIAGGLATLTAFVWLGLGKLVALLPYASLWWTVHVVQAGAGIPWGSLEVNAFGRLLASSYYILFAAGFVWWLVRQEQEADTWIPRAWRPALQRAMLAAVVVALPLWGGASWWLTQADGKLHLYLAGHNGVADFVIVTPAGNRVLLSPARDPDFEIDSLLAQVKGGNKAPDLLLLTRPQAPAPHLEASPRQTLRPTSPLVRQGTVLQLDAGVTLRVLALPAAPDDSLLLALQYGNLLLLLPNENTQESQLALLDEALPARSVFVAPYPRTGAWPAPAWLEHLQPQLSLLPAGATYPPSVQQSLRAHGLPVEIPADAIVELVTDGKTIQLLNRSYAPR